MAGDITINSKTLKMNNGLTMPEDMFCIFFVEYGDEKKAYARAFDVEMDRVPRAAVNQLFQNFTVVRRIEQLYNRRISLMEVAAVVDIDRLTRELECARQMAMDNNQAAAAVTATLGKAKLHGLLTDKHQFTIKRPGDMTEEELRYIIEGEYKELPNGKNSEGGGVAEGQPAGAVDGTAGAGHAAAADSL